MGDRNIPFLRLLQAATGVAKELVLVAQHLAGTELPQAGRDARVLLYVNRQV